MITCARKDDKNKKIRNIIDKSSHTIDDDDAADGSRPIILYYYTRIRRDTRAAPEETPSGPRWPGPTTAC